MVTIKVRQNGSLLVEGEDVRLVDWNGQEYVLNKKPFALCRCGQSKRRPFCDSSHKLCNFQAAEAAPGPNAPPAPDAPAAR
ncbi:MAG TPA: CDGSH iron-sulfur domain-containing protein [Vicinamibacterales bacterium]|nr:CDGSH iron-sulfur domain-containing protein [Vicinamibacterales bacterium]